MSTSTAATPGGPLPPPVPHHDGTAPPPQRDAGARGNRLLAALPDEDLQRLLPWLEPVSLPLGHVICETGQVLNHAWFPTSAIVSLLYVTESGASAEIAVVGNDGLIGIPLLMGGGSSTSQAVVQSAGEGWRLPGRVVREEFARGGPLTTLLLRYTQALIAQTAQVAVCNRHHSVNQQLCRWLLLRLDRQPGVELAVTHELIARLLGVRREGVTEAALALQHSGLISYRRGHVTVLDRAGLQARSCECYAVVKAEYDRLLPQGRPLRR